ncbi:MAG: A/G-specific adenine glycosylase [Verrucomicrobiales bacterium]|nr:A/G-specific adenine glycosylase [Verrucomicrobiales bacterium]
MTERLVAWFEINKRDLPWRKTRDPYAIWVSEIMLQQTQVATVIPYFERWMGSLPSISHLADADPQQLLKLWEGLGYYTRVKNMQKAALRIVELHESVFPTDFQHILALNGIGPYTAGAISSIAFNQPSPILDGNVIRILTRLFALKTDVQTNVAKIELWTLARELVEQAHASMPDRPQACSHFNQAMMELGATVCLPKKPLCGVCPVAEWCEARKAGTQEQFPINSKKTEYTKRYFCTLIFQRENQFLIRQRSAAEVNGMLWEFPTTEIDESEFKATFAQSKRKHTLLGTVKFAITRYHNKLVAIRQSDPLNKNLPDGIWKTLTELKALPFSSAQKRVLQLLLEPHPAKTAEQPTLL